MLPTEHLLVMNRSVSPPSHPAGGSRMATLGLALCGLLVCAIAISAQSYWIDEGSTAWKACQPTLGKWWRELMTYKGSDLQMPLYMLFVWGWEKVTGLNEFAMRAGNALWFLLGVIALARALANRPLVRAGVCLALLVNPFVWYYLDELRPYALQLGASLVVFAALYRLGQKPVEPGPERCAVVGLCLGSVLLATGGGLLGMLWTGAFLGAAALSVPKDRGWELARHHWISLGLTFSLLFAGGLYYLWTMSVGARAASVGTTDVRNALFIGFELLGFTGLGPGRLAIRTGGLRVFLHWLPLLGIYGLVLLILLAQGWKALAASTSRRTRFCWVVAFLLVLGFILAVGVVTPFRVLGRHCTPLLVPILFVLGTGLATVLSRGGWPARMIVPLFIGLSLFSDATVRWSERHAKDNYRGAAALGREALARGESVWWNADPQCALVYGVPVLTAATSPQAAVFIIDPAKGFARTLPRPDLVVASKPDLYDIHGGLAEYLTQAGYHQTAAFTAFTVWRAPGK
jgi:hypothetical protein